MNNTLAEYIMAGVDLLIVGVALNLTISILSSINMAQSQVALHNANSAGIDYYQQYSQYDNKTITSAEVVSALAYYGDHLEVVVVNESGQIIAKADPVTHVIKDASNNIVDSTTTLSTLISNVALYKSYVSVDSVLQNNSYSGGTIDGIYIQKLAFP